MAIDLSAVSGMTPSGLAVPGYIEEEIKKTRRLREEQELVAAAIRSAAAATGAGSSGFSAMGEAIGSVSKLLSSLHGQFGSTIKGATDLSFSLQAVAGSTPGDISALSASLEISSGKAKAAANDFLGLGAAFGAIKGHIAANIGDWAAQGVGKLVDVQRELDKLNTTMVAATGSSANAAREFEWLRQFAMDTPVSLAEVTQGFVKMKAAGLDPTKESLTSFSNTATAMGVDFGKTIDAVTSAADGDFGGLAQLGINAKKEGDNVALTFQGVTTTVKNNSDEIVGYIEKIGNTTFDGATAKHAQTLDGALSKLGNTWDELFRSISEGDVGTLIFDSVTLANGVLRDAVSILKAVGGAAGDTGKDLGALSMIQSGIATVFETVAVLGVNLKYVLVTIGNEIGGLVAQIAQGAQAAGRFLVGDFTGAKESASAFAEIRRQMVADADAARTEVDATTARILKARDVVKGSSQTSSNAAPNPPASASLRSGDVDAGSGGPPATPAQPVSVPAVAAVVCGNPAACSSCCKPGPTPAAQAVTMQQSQSQQQQARVAAEASTSSQAAAKAAVVAAVSASSSSSLSGFIPPTQGPETPPKKTEEVADEYRKATEAIRQQTAELSKQRETLQASIKTLGMSEIAIARLNIKETKERINAAVNRNTEDDNPDRLKALREQLAEQEKTAATKEEADFSKRNHALKEQIEQSRENNALVQQEINLTGMSQLERSKIAALRTIEVRQAKELRDIEKSDHAEPRKKELSDQVREKSRIDAETEVQKLVQADWQKTADQINGSLTDAFMKSLESGKDFGKNLGNALKEQFKSLVLKPTISAMMSPIAGGLSTVVSGIMGGGTGPGASSGIMSLFNGASAANSAYNLYNGTGPLASAYNAVSGWMGFGSAAASSGGISALASTAPTVASQFATGAGGIGLKAAGGVGLKAGTGAQLGSMQSGTVLGGGGMGALATAGVVVAVMAAVLNVLGAFKSDRKVGSGLVGTLGNGSTLSPWEEWREGGTLVSGPSFSTHNPLESLKKHKEQLQALRDAGQGASAQAMALQAVVTQMTEATKGLADATKLQSEAIQKGYGDLRKNVVRMGDNLGLAGDSVKSFAYTLAQQDLNFDGLKPEEIQAKISAVMGKAGANLAEQLLGRYKDVTETVYDTIQTQQASEAFDPIFVQNERVVTRKEYEASEFAKTGETALDTLTRLSDRFIAVNDASEAMGFGLHTASLAAADFASDVVDAFGGLERFTATTGSFLQNFYTGEEQKQAMASQGSRALKAAGVNITPEQLLGGSRESVKTAMQSWIATGVGAESYAPVMEILNSLSPMWASYESAAPAVENLTNAVDEMTQKFISAKDALANDAKSLAVELLRAQGNEAAAKALEKANYLSQFAGLDEPRRQELATGYDTNTGTRRAIDVQNERNGLQNELNGLTDTSVQALARQRNALDESNRALFDNVQAVKLQKTIAQELPGVLDKYRLPAQRRKAQYGSVADDLTAVGIGVTADQLANASKGQFADAAMAVYNLGTTTDDMRLALVRAAGVMADIKDAEVDEAFANLQRVVGLQQEIATKTRDDIKAVFDLLRSSVDELYSEVDSTARMRAAEGQDYIAKTLAVAQSGGKILDAEELGKAISAARSGLDSTQYTSQFERDKDRLVLAGKLSDLEDISGEQLSEAERQVKYLEDLVKDGQAQIDELRGINGGVGSVAEAVQALADAINGKNTTATPPPSNKLQGSGLASYDTVKKVGTNSAGTAFTAAGLQQAAREAIAAAPNVETANRIYDVIHGSGFTLRQAEEILGARPGSLEEEAKLLGREVFHRGTPFVRQTGYALLQRGEAVFPTAYNPFINARGMGDTGRLEAHLEKLTGEVMRLQSLQTLGNTHAQATVELLDNVTEGGNGMRAEIMNKVELAA